MKVKLFREWYARPDVKFEIIKFLKDREFAMLTPTSDVNNGVKDRSTRTLRCHSVQHFDFIMKPMMKTHLIESVYNLYYSLAWYQGGVDKLGANLRERDTSDWVRNHWKKMEGYDFLIDIDAPSHSQLMYAHESAKAIKSRLDSAKVPYEVRFSGCGFHFIIPAYFFENVARHYNPDEADSIYDFYTSISNLLYENISELVDWNICDSRRIVKVPYSLAFYEEVVYVCYPFKNNEEFENFKLTDALPHKWKNIRDRGTFMFNGLGCVAVPEKLLEVIA